MGSHALDEAERTVTSPIDPLFHLPSPRLGLMYHTHRRLVSVRGRICNEIKVDRGKGYLIYFSRLILRKCGGRSNDDLIHLSDVGQGVLQMTLYYAKYDQRWRISSAFHGGNMSSWV